MFRDDEVCDLVQIDLTRVRKIRAALVQPDAVQGLADTFSALGDPTRVRILDALSHGELCVCDLAAVLGVSQSAVSHQLRLLRGLRLVGRGATAASSSIPSTTSTSCRSSSRRCSTSKKVAAPSASAIRRTRVATARRRGATDNELLDERRPRDRLLALRNRTPAPTGARIRGWFTGLAAALVVAACALAGSRRSRSGVSRSSLPPRSSARCFRPSARGSRSRAPRSTSTC